LWFRSTPEFDARIQNQFEALWVKLQGQDYSPWEITARGCLALVIIFDQFPLNMYRGEAKAFATESQAIRITKLALEKRFDQDLNDDEVAFLYMPLMHSENLKDQNLSVRLYERRGLDKNLRFAKHHRDLVRRFGRFPHRNALLGRTSTPAEKEYLGSKEAFLG
jgi:uncharacterized protein (DUF924 family)